MRDEISRACVTCVTCVKGASRHSLFFVLSKGSLKSRLFRKSVDGRPSTWYDVSMQTEQIIPAVEPVKVPPLRRIQKQLVADDVEFQLREAILSGALAPGATLAEAALASQLGVSRASIRQAKFRLASDGLLEFNERGTAVIRKLTEADAVEIIEFREILELAASTLACSRMTNEAVNAMQENIRLTAQEQNLLKLTHLDIAFHEEIIRAAGNSRLMSAWCGLRPQLELWLAGMHRNHSAVTDQTREETVRGHRALLAALQAGDPEVMEQLVREHVTGFRAFFSAGQAAQTVAERKSDEMSKGEEL